MYFLYEKYGILIRISRFFIHVFPKLPLIINQYFIGADNALMPNIAEVISSPNDIEWYSRRIYASQGFAVTEKAKSASISDYILIKQHCRPFY